MNKHHEVMANPREEEEESFLLIYLSLFGIILYLVWLRRERTSYQGIPSVGWSGTLTSYITALRFSFNPCKVLEEGYAKFPNGIFRVPTFVKWIVVVTKPQYIEELRSTPEEQLSTSLAMKEILHLPYTIGSRLLADSQLVALLGTQLTRHLHFLLPEMRDEVKIVFDGLVTKDEADWIPVDAPNFMVRVSNQAINRALVGRTLCRKPGFLDVTAAIANEMRKCIWLLNKIPTILHPLIATFLPVARMKWRVQKILSVTLKERQEIFVKVGRPFPEDLITWMNDGSSVSINELAGDILMVNYLAVHPITRILTQALHSLATRPECAETLRMEVELAVKQEGWSIAVFDKMPALESFLKETLRLDGRHHDICYPLLNMPRKTQHRLTFSDGLTVPRGSLLFIGAGLVHCDEQYYPEPAVLRPFRFLRGSDSFPSIHTTHTPSPFSSPSKSQEPQLPSAPSILTTTSSTFLVWGHGRHACPGRFFAAAVMKLVLGCILVEFDVRLLPAKEENGGLDKHGNKVEVRRRHAVDRVGA